MVWPRITIIGTTRQMEKRVSRGPPCPRYKGAGPQHPLKKFGTPTCANTAWSTANKFMGYHTWGRRVSRGQPCPSPKGTGHQDPQFFDPYLRPNRLTYSNQMWYYDMWGCGVSRVSAMPPSQRGVVQYPLWGRRYNKQHKNNRIQICQYILPSCTICVAHYH